MNFIAEFKKGQRGGNKGIPFGPGFLKMSNAVNGLQRSRLYGFAAAPKAGKSTLVDYIMLIQPYIYSCIHPEIDIEWIYLSFELNRISKEFDIATYFLYHDYNIVTISLEEGVLKDGKNYISLSPDYIRGRVQDDEGNLIKVKPSIEEVLKEVYRKRIIPLFGEFNENGTQISKGKITFVEQKDNPTGWYKFFEYHAEQNGEFIRETFGNSVRIRGYKPHNPEKYTIVITDHLRKLMPERGWQLKRTIDKYIEYTIDIKNWCDYTFAHIIHTNREIVNQSRMNFAKDFLYPTSDDIKDTGNLAEDADYVFTIFNPNDDRYKLNTHFGVPIKDKQGNPLYPNLRTVHLVESRHSQYPLHFKTNMFGGLKSFQEIQLID